MPKAKTLKLKEGVNTRRRKTDRLVKTAWDKGIRRIPDFMTETGLSDTGIRTSLIRLRLDWDHYKGYGMLGKKMSEECKKKISKAMMGKVMTEETRRKLSVALKGRKVSEETRGKISRAMKGRSTWNKGIPRSEEAKRKMSETHMGHEVSEETREKISKANKGRLAGPKNPNWIDGRSKLPYPPEWTTRFRRSIRERDGNYCHYPGCDATKGLCIHHIDYDKMNCNPLNLITLCNTHNVKVNGNRDYWEEYFSKYLGAEVELR